MSDEIDIANEQADKIRERQLSVRKPSGPVATGFCYNCGYPVRAGWRWCDTDCRADHEARIKRENN